MRSASRDAGGIFEVEVALAKELTSLGCSVVPFGTIDDHSELDAVKWSPIVPKCFLHYGNDSFRYSPKMKSEFLGENLDLCHLHSLWSYTSLVASKWAHGNGKPLLVSPNGMLDPWALKHSPWKKKVVSFLIERKMLSRAACIQANTEKDVADYRAFGLNHPVAIIPNGVYAPDASSLIPTQDRFFKDTKKQAVYLGRIHPKKGLVNFVQAWGMNQERLRRSNWQLVIAGKDEAGHLAKLTKLCDECGLRIGSSTQCTDADVVFMGPTYGSDKHKLLTSSHLFVLPSFSEGLPMAVLEAWAHGTPAMISPQCNLSVGFDCGAAISVEPTVESISKGLSQTIELSCDELSQMAKRGRRLVEEQFVWSSIAEKMLSLYRWLIAGGDRPDFVTT